MIPLLAIAILIAFFALSQHNIGLALFVAFLGCAALVHMNEKSKIRWIEIFTDIGVLSVILCGIMGVAGVIYHNIP
mgnify:CR=1|tara:strand:- start:97 stop:324 length:228 start_codon:yes stop_codon:yes gene_type:complete